MKHAMLIPNVRFRSNVLCVKNGKEELDNSEIVSRLGYFELIEYRRVNGVLWNQQPNYTWTARQRHELNGPRGRGNDAFGGLWKKRPEFQPMPGAEADNPFDTGNPVRSTRKKAAETSSVNPFHIEPIAIPVPDFIPEQLVNEQDVVITAGIDRDLLVVAPPGTGKTHTLIERIEYLVSNGYVNNPSQEVLVLSFTRSAVSELKKRLAAKFNAGRDEKLLYVKISTFDSLATYCLKNDIDRDDIVSGFSERIAQFNKLLASGKLPNSEDDISKLRFLLVDEVQDLNGQRARMVLALAGYLARNNGCCMFLGDPAQAIYDFEEKDSKDKFTSVDFLKQLSRGDYSGAAPVRIEFSTYRRFETDAMLQFVHEARFAMGDDGLSPDGSRLDELLRTLGAKMPFDTVKTEIGGNGSTAILVRNNLEAYSVWSWCNSQGIDSTLWRGSSENYWPGWIGRLFTGFQSDRISIEKAKERWKEYIAPLVSISFEQAIEYLKNQGLIDEGDDSIQLSEIASRMRNNVPVSSGNEVNASLVISTIHRSKGLEFDHVLLLPPDRMDSDDELRVIYVAATRARRSLRLLSRDGTIIRKGYKNWKGLRTNGFRVYKYPHYPFIGLLLDGYDVMDHRSVLNLPDSLKSQRELWAECSGRQRNIRISEGIIYISDTEIGKLSNSSFDDIEKISRARNVVPGVLEGLQIFDLATVVFDDFETNAADVLGKSCMAIVPVFTGIVSI